MSDSTLTSTKLVTGLIKDHTIQTQRASYNRLPTELLVHVLKGVAIQANKVSIKTQDGTAHCAVPIVVDPRCSSPRHVDEVIFRLLQQGNGYLEQALDAVAATHRLALVISGFDRESLGHLLRGMEDLTRFRVCGRLDVHFEKCNTHLTLETLVKWAYIHRLKVPRWQLTGNFTFAERWCDRSHPHKTLEDELMRDIAKLSLTPTEGLSTPNLLQHIANTVMESQLPREYYKYTPLMDEIRAPDLASRMVALWQECEPRKSGGRWDGWSLGDTANILAPCCLSYWPEKLEAENKRYMAASEAQYQLEQELREIEGESDDEED